MFLYYLGSLYLVMGSDGVKVPFAVFQVARNLWALIYMVTLLFIACHSFYFGRALIYLSVVSCKCIWLLLFSIVRLELARSSRDYLASWAALCDVIYLLLGTYRCIFLFSEFHSLLLVAMRFTLVSLCSNLIG